MEYVILSEPLHQLGELVHVTMVTEIDQRFVKMFFSNKPSPRLGFMARLSYSLVYYTVIIIQDDDREQSLSQMY